MKGEQKVAEISMDDLKPNSHQYNRDSESAVEKKKVEKVVSGKVIQKKKSLGRRFIDIFFADGESIGNIKAYLIEDVLVPAIKENIADSINGAINMLFFGEVRKRSSGNKSTNTTRINYGGYFLDGSKRERVARSIKERENRQSLEDYIFESRADAEQVLDEMEELLDVYKQVTVADYLDMLDITSDQFTDNNFGWTDLSKAKVVRVRDGYRLELPREIALGR